MRRMYDDGGKNLAAIFRRAKDAGATTSCDMALPDPVSEAGQAPWSEILDRLLPHVDVFLPSVEEALFMTDSDTFMQMRMANPGRDLIDVLTPGDFSRIAGELLQKGAKMTALKAGHRGFYFRSSKLTEMGRVRPPSLEAWSNRELWCPAFEPPRFGSATGSGDSSIAGFLAALLRGLSIEKTLRAATCLGWQNVQVLDALSGIGTWEQTQQQLDLRLPVLEPNIDAEGWHWASTTRVWLGPHDVIPAQ